MRIIRRSANSRLADSDQSGLPPIRAARIFDEARTAHLERIALMTPAHFIYRRRRYDFDESLAHEMSAHRRSRLSTVWFLLTTDLDRVEINEPALIRAWPGLLSYVTAIRVKDRFKRRSTSVVAYAMENADVPGTLASRTGLPRATSLWITRLVIRYLVSATTRLVFATEQARANYLSLVPDVESKVQCRLIPALPTPCSFCPSGSKEPIVTFLGSFEERKGLMELMEAWPILRSLAPQGRLKLMGKGELESLVVAWAGATPGVEVIIDPPRDVIHNALNLSKALVLFSIPDRRWREQVGLPILEGLAHGCEIVTSDQTGIAPWLSAHGHAVLPAGADAAGLAAGMAQALGNTRSPREVTADLPSEDARILADRWLFGSGAA